MYICKLYGKVSQWKDWTIRTFPIKNPWPWPFFWNGFNAFQKYGKGLTFNEMKPDSMAGLPWPSPNILAFWSRLCKAEEVPRRFHDPQESDVWFHNNLSSQGRFWWKSLLSFLKSSVVFAVGVQYPIPIQYDLCVLPLTIQQTLLSQNRF